MSGVPTGPPALAFSVPFFIFSVFLQPRGGAWTPQAFLGCSCGPVGALHIVPPDGGCGRSAGTPRDFSCGTDAHVRANLRSFGRGCSWIEALAACGMADERGAHRVPDRRRVRPCGHNRPFARPTGHGVVGAWLWACRSLQPACATSITSSQWEVRCAMCSLC